MSMDDMFGPKPVTLDSMVACAKRELAMRESVYPRRVAAGKMKQHSADNEIRVMKGILRLLEIVKSAPNQRVTHQPDGTVNIQDPAEEAGG